MPTQRITLKDLDQQLEREANLRRARAVRAELDGAPARRAAALAAIIRALTEQLAEHTGDPVAVIDYAHLQAACESPEPQITVDDQAVTRVDVTAGLTGLLDGTDVAMRAEAAMRAASEANGDGAR
jgi:hypothetical protein